MPNQLCASSGLSKVSFLTVGQKYFRLGAALSQFRLRNCAGCIRSSLPLPSSQTRARLSHDSRCDADSGTSEYLETAAGSIRDDDQGHIVHLEVNAKAVVKRHIGSLSSLFLRRAKFASLLLMARTEAQEFGFLLDVRRRACPAVVALTAVRTSNDIASASSRICNLLLTSFLSIFRVPSLIVVSFFIIALHSCPLRLDPRHSER